MSHDRLTTQELFEALEALLDSDQQRGDLIRELQVRQLELEIQNRELRETQQQLAHSRTRYADLYDFSPIGYASLNENGRIEEINITAGKLLGNNPHKLIDRTFSEFIVPEDAQRFAGHLRRCLVSRQKRSIELRLVTEGTPDVELFTMATYDVDRHTLQFRMAMLNITARKTAEEAVRQWQEKEANRLKDEFLAVVSHELRTPLTPILGAIYKLRATRPDDEEMKTSLDMIERNARAQARIVEELLDISRITRGKLDFNRQPASFLLIVKAAIDVVLPGMKARGIHLRETLEEPAAPVWCDRDRIQQVICNLLSNAIKFTPQGGTIDVRLENHPRAARLTISDSGVGINQDFLPHVFEHFRQAGSFTTRMHGGLGIGLSIVRYIVEQHGGTVQAASGGEGQGASFTVELPFNQGVWSP